MNQHDDELSTASYEQAVRLLRQWRSVLETHSGGQHMIDAKIEAMKASDEQALRLLLLLEEKGDVKPNEAVFALMVAAAVLIGGNAADADHLHGMIKHLSAIFRLRAQQFFNDVNADRRPKN
jgi:hypothetical protein